MILFRSGKLARFVIHCPIHRVKDTRLRDLVQRGNQRCHGHEHRAHCDKFGYGVARLVAATHGSTTTDRRVLPSACFSKLDSRRRLKHGSVYLPRLLE